MSWLAMLGLTLTRSGRFLGLAGPESCGPGRILGLAYFKCLTETEWLLAY